MKILKNLMLFAFLAVTLVAVNACRETMEGAGEDIENAGDAVRDATN